MPPGPAASSSIRARFLISPVLNFAIVSLPTSLQTYRAEHLDAITDGLCERRKRQLASTLGRTRHERDAPSIDPGLVRGVGTALLAHAARARTAQSVAADHRCGADRRWWRRRCH